MRLSEIASEVGLRVLRDGSFVSLGFVTHHRPGLLVFLANDRYLAALHANTLASCVITNMELAGHVPAALGVGIVDDPQDAFYRLHDFLARQTTFYGVPRDTRIAPTARIHERAVVSPSDVDIADGVVIGPCVTILPGVSIGEGSTIRAGTVLGSEGFQVRLTNGSATRVLHAGRVRIGQRVDIHSNTCVDRSLFAETVIGDETTIDNLVYIAHDVIIGRAVRIVAQAMIAGSAHIGDGAWIGPSASISSGVQVGPRAWVSLGSVVTRDVPPGARVTGNFAIDHETFLAHLRTIR